ncbi:MacS family sensor histidine kinase [Nocardiopsis listeri]|uniref:MacS family sensor histidine kinase n=1 Tax=Nocardiopsis listeri TaxID=53440 RepID=UPI003530B2BB
MVHALVMVARNHEYLERPWIAWLTLVVMAIWTVVTHQVYAVPSRRTSRFLCADLLVAFGCLFATAPAAAPFYLTQAPPLSAYWFAGAALAASVIRGRRGAATVAIAYGIADLTLRVIMDAAITGATARGVVLLLLTGLAVGYMARVSEQAEERFAQAVALEARIREREQLARSIHDSVLQVLALVRRRGDEIGGEAADLGRMAGEQEVRLRSLVADGLGAPAALPGAPAGAAGPLDLRDLLRPLETVRVTVAAPATRVELPDLTARELTAAVAAALDNVERHCPEGTRAWVLVEDEPDAVVVTVRDDGPGIPPDRLERARAEGRLGVDQSILGRVRDLGGSTEIHSEPGEGTEFEMRVPRSAT